MYMKTFVVVLAALLAGASAIPAASSNAKLAARTPEHEELLSKTRAVNLDKIKRQADCPPGDNGDPVCFTCINMGDDECCTATDMVTKQTISDGCTYFGGGKTKARAVDFDKIKRQADCPPGQNNDPVCFICTNMGDDECCTATDMVTKQTISDACTYFGGGKA